MRILIAVDCGPLSESIIKYGAGLAASTNGRVGILTVIEPHSKGQIRIDLTQELHRLTKLVSASIQVHSFTRLGDPLEEILQTSEEWAADCLVVGAQSPTLTRLFLQKDITGKIVRSSKVPIFVVPRNKSHRVQRYLGFPNREQAMADLGDI